MRLKIDIGEVRFRVAGTARPRTESQQSKAQKVTPDGRPVWVVKLIAIDSGAGADGSMEAIWVEVAGPQPVLTLDGLAAVEGLTHTPWVNKQGKLVRAFRADSIAMTDGARRAA
jgi:hypothetical protein